MRRLIKPLTKITLYPIAITAIIILITICNWLLTAFFAFIFDTTIDNVSTSPIILLYIGSGVGTLYMCVIACQYIAEEF